MGGGSSPGLPCPAFMLEAGIWFLGGLFTGYLIFKGMGWL